MPTIFRYKIAFYYLLSTGCHKTDRIVNKVIVTFEKSVFYAIKQKLSLITAINGTLSHD